MHIVDRIPGIAAGRFAARRARVLDDLGTSALVVPAGPSRFKNGDTEYRFRPDSEFLWLTGWGEPEALLVLRGHAADDRCVLFVPPRVPEAELWTGTRLGVEGACAELGADAAFPIDEMESRLPDLLDGAEHVYVRLGREPALDRIVVATLGSARARAQRTGGRPVGVLDPGLLLDEHRLVKDDDELALIRTAAALSVQAFRAAIPRVAAGVGEWEIQAALEGTFLAGGAWGPAFGTIVAGGAHACTLHYTRNDARLPEDGWVLIDAGAEVAGYGGDITRSLPVTGRGTPAQRDLHDVVRAARDAALAVARPGATIDDVERAVRDRLETGLVELGLASRADAEQRRARLGRLFPHKSGHWLGLDVHDVGLYRVHGAARTLDTGMVFTVEPGLYVPADDDQAPPELRGVGIRLEDDVLITAEGCENLTAALPMDVDGLIALREGGTA